MNKPYLLNAAAAYYAAYMIVAALASAAGAADGHWAAMVLRSGVAGAAALATLSPALQRRYWPAAVGAMIPGACKGLGINDLAVAGALIAVATAWLLVLKLRRRTNTK